MHGFQLFVVPIYWRTCVLTFGGCGAVSFAILFVFCLLICLCLWEVSRKCVEVWAVGARWVMCLWGAASWKSARGGATRFLPVLAPLLARVEGWRRDMAGPGHLCSSTTLLGAWWCSLQCCAGLIVCELKRCLLIQSNVTCLEEYVPHKRFLLRVCRVVKNVDHQAASCGLVWSEMIHNMTLCQMDFCWAIVKRPGCCFSTSFEKTMGFGVFVSPPIVALNNTSLKLQVFSSFKRPKIQLISQKCNKIIFLIVVYLLGHKKVWSCNFKFCGFSREHVNRNWLNNWHLRANQNSWG